MNKKTMIGYIEGDSWIHQLKGSTKLVCFLLLSISVMITFDTRLLFGIVILSFILFRVSKIELRQVRVILYFILVFLIINMVMIYILAPEEGVKIFGSRTVLLDGIGPYTVTLEQLWYMLNVLVKYFALAPLSILFMVTTYPSEFAASLNKIGVPYKVAYSVSIAFRYIPTVQEDFVTIFQAQQARGIDMSSKQSFFAKVKNVSYTLFPLIFSSLNKIDIISNAMLLRGFGQDKKRTWYHDRSTNRNDMVALVFCVLCLLLSIALMGINQGRFYYPF